MTRSKHSEAQIITALKQVEAGCKAEDVAPEVGYRSYSCCPTRTTIKAV